jgi:hypothetical protein
MPPSAAGRHSYFFPRDQLSHQAHEPATVLSLLESFRDEARQSLLFLKNVARVDAMRWRAGATAPEPIWSCRVENVSKQLSKLRTVVPESVARAQVRLAHASS